MISVVVPVYKVEEYLRRCVDSVLAQTFRDFELILVDDGSPDRCGQICDEYAASDGRIKVIHQENGGLSAARNAGLNVAQGEHVAFVDSDDYCHPEMLNVLYEKIVQYNADVAVSGFKRVDLNGDKIDNESYTPVTEEVLDGNEALKRIVAEVLPGYIWNKLYKRDVFKSIRFPTGKLYEDDFIAPRIFYQSKRVVVVPRSLYFYTVNPRSITARPKTVRHLDVVESKYRRFLFLQEIGFPKEYREQSARTTIGYYWYFLKEIEISPKEKKRFYEIKRMVRHCYKNRGMRMKYSERLEFDFPVLFKALKRAKGIARSFLSKGRLFSDSPGTEDSADA